ncbi:thiamine pyrophosphate-binding protein [Nonomuraea rubra]|uniref:thiamine pyrophosphate-binding protein n=1 Tax=Nonomuraea rubra TaxID=46180 RepID=UPI003CD06148
MTTGADQVAAALDTLGVRHVFAIAGIHNLPILRALRVWGGIRIVGMRHEQTAVHAADGYARTTGTFGVALVSTGSGTAKAMAGLYEASSPPPASCSSPARWKAPIWAGAAATSTRPTAGRTCCVRCAAPSRGPAAPATSAPRSSGWPGTCSPGGGVVGAGATAELTRLAEAAQAPVVTSREGRGALAEDHPLCLGAFPAGRCAQDWCPVRPCARRGS